jgi:hypothetical protein
MQAFFFDFFKILLKSSFQAVSARGKKNNEKLKDLKKL